MPFLRFTKDRRGYESTFLLHAQPAGERDAPILLYWFRTPPHVKMGRAALDEETIRALEDTHPSVDFDWPRILAARPQPSEPPPDPNRPPRARRRGDRVEERGARPSRPLPSGRGAPQPAAPPLVADRPPEPDIEEYVPPPQGIVLQEATAADASAEPVEPEVPVRKFTRIFDAAPEPVAGRLSEQSASDRALGGEQLERLRGRYAAVMSRIARRVADPALADRLRAIAERVNPDAWVTDDEVRAGLAGLNDVYAQLVPHVGRRRRRRRSGRRQITLAEGQGTASSGVEAASPESADTDAAGDGPDEDDSPEPAEE